MNPILQDWFTPIQIDRRTLWRWLQPDADRLARQYWWGPLPLRDVRVLMRMAAGFVVQGRHAAGLHAGVRERPGRDAIALAVLEEALKHVKDQHEDSYQVMLDVALAALRRGADRPLVMRDVLAAARDRQPLPPPWLVEHSIEAAGREYRIASRFWRARAA